MKIVKYEQRFTKHDAAFKFKMIWNAPEDRKSEEVVQTTVVQSPAPVQPVIQPTTTVVINNTGFQQAPNQFQPQQQVSYQT